MDSIKTHHLLTNSMLIAAEIKDNLKHQQKSLL